ncbi:ester cyclase [Mycobacterium sp. MYCO198283]|uniref:ester cyclase n=1 Tax=Mycobacterium sp. MYCO198283 TaxID=2883505 RepID=UPI001E5AB783|nr:nuclear transport factor 2 family protein [Mycobacterium sp. MYCO198283]MCG5432345.1 ester cyclase [Mycobacterium sp. MYCO198283]
MTDAADLYRRWIDELWAGAPVARELVSDDFVGHWPQRDVRGPDELADVVAETHRMLADLTFTVVVGPIVDGDLLAARWEGSGRTPEGPMAFTGNDILRFADGRFVEYWTGTSTQ